MSQSSDCQSEPRDNGQGMEPSLYEELFSAQDTPHSTYSDSPPGSTHSGSVDAEAFILPSSPPFPPPVVPTNGSWPGDSGVSDEAYVPFPPDPSGPLCPGRQSIDPMASARRLSYLQGETLDDDGGFHRLGALDTVLPSSPPSYLDYTSVDTTASVVDHTNHHQPAQVSFLGEVPDDTGPQFRRVTYPTPAVHAAASGRLQSNTRSATFPLPSYPTYSNHTPHGVWPQRSPLDTFSSQDGIDGIPLATFPTSTSMISPGVPFPMGNAMSLGPAAFSRPSGHAPVYGPSISAPTISDAPSISSAVSIPMTPKKMNSAHKRPTPRKTTSRACIEPGSVTQSHGGPMIKQRARAELKKGSVISFGDGCRLDNVAALPVDYDTVAFEGQTFTQKASFRFEVSDHNPFNRQFNVLHGGKQPTKRRLAEVAVVAVKRFIGDCVTSGRPCERQLQHFVLLRIEVDSRSGLRLIFGL